MRRPAAAAIQARAPVPGVILWGILISPPLKDLDGGSEPDLVPDRIRDRLRADSAGGQSHAGTVKGGSGPWSNRATPMSNGCGVGSFLPWRQRWFRPLPVRTQGPGGLRSAASAIRKHWTLRRNPEAMSRAHKTSSPARAWTAALLIALVTAASAQQPAPAQPAAPAAPADKVFTEAELASLLAPIALYPDNVIAQILMASTYPIEVIEAYRWLQKHKELKGDALYNAVQKEEWDDSVKSLVNAPDVLKQMDENLGWMQKIGDAFLAQQKEVLAMVQTLRGKAMKEGTLKSDEHMKVSTQAAAPATATATATAPVTVVKQEKETQVIVIESASPNVVYVPTYNPATMYGAWGYPAYPPYYYPPPMGYPGSGFWFGMSIGIIAGGAWGGGGWGHGDVNVNWNGGDVNVGNGNRGGNRNQVNPQGGQRGSRTGTGAQGTAQNRGGGQGAQGRGAGGAQGNGTSRGAGGQGGGQSWSHNPEHRKGASYRDSGTASKFGGSTGAGSGSRDSFRGRTGDAGGAGGAGSRPSAGTTGTGNRASGGAGGGAGSRGSAGTTGGNRGTGTSGTFSGGGSASGSGSARGSSGSGSSGSRGSSGSSFSGGGSGSRGSSGSSSAFGGMSSGSRSGSYGSRGSSSRGGGGGGGRGGGGGGRRLFQRPRKGEP